MPPSFQTTTYDPVAYFTDRYPGWQLIIDPLDGGDREEIDFDEQVARVTPGFFSEGPTWCFEHVGAHIEMHDGEGYLTEDDCAIANTLAQIRLYP
jgi:hypothetical protein